MTNSTVSGNQDAFPMPSDTTLSYMTDSERSAFMQLLDARDEIQVGPEHVLVSSGLDDFDDWAAIFSIATLTRMKLMYPRLFVVGLQGSQYRSRVTKGVLRELGMGDIEVVRGSDRTSRPVEEVRSYALIDEKLLAKDYEIIDDGIGRISTVLQEEIQGKVKLLGLASFTDFADFACQHEVLFDDNVRETILMGGVLQRSEQDDTSAANLVLEDNDQMLLPNTIAVNNRFDRKSTETLFARAQQAGDFSVVTRQGAYGTKLDMQVLEAIDVLGYSDPIAKFASDRAKQLLQNLWVRILDGEIPRSKQWFFDTFNYGKNPFEGTSLTKQQLKLQPMIMRVERFVPYDLLAVLAALDDRIQSKFFAPTEIQRPSGRRKRVYGLSQANSGIKSNPEIDLPSLMGALIKYPLLERMEKRGKI